MRKKKTLEKFENIIMDNGIAHIVYCQNGINDVVHPFSVAGEEALSEDFVEAIEKYRPVIPDDVPLVVEVTGSPLSDCEKEMVEKASWGHFCFQMGCDYKAARDTAKMGLMYILYTIASAILLFVVEGEPNEFVVNLAYIIFWFFGYRLLIYLILDCAPKLRDKKWNRQLASMKIIFTEGDITGAETIINEAPFADSEAAGIIDEIRRNGQRADEWLKQFKTNFRNYKRTDSVTMTCVVESMDDVLQTHGIRGKEFLSDELAGYLGYAEPFLPDKEKITLEICGAEFSEEEQRRIKDAIQNYFEYRIAEEEYESKDNEKWIFLFGVFIAISAVLLCAWGKKVDVAWHEFILVLAYFFGDYLLEFILINKKDIRKKKKMLRNLRNMQLKFDN